jgi:hypothetical protein
LPKLKHPLCVLRAFVRKLEKQNRQLPDDLSKYPLVIASTKEIAIVAVHPKQGYLLYKNGTKTELGDLQKILDDTPSIPTGSYQWAYDTVQKEKIAQEAELKAKEPPFKWVRSGAGKLVLRKNV